MAMAMAAPASKINAAIPNGNCQVAWTEDSRKSLFESGSPNSARCRVAQAAFMCAPCQIATPDKALPLAKSRSLPATNENTNRRRELAMENQAFRYLIHDGAGSAVILDRVAAGYPHLNRYSPYTTPSSLRSAPRKHHQPPHDSASSGPRPR